MTSKIKGFSAGLLRKSKISVFSRGRKIFLALCLSYGDADNRRKGRFHVDSSMSVSVAMLHITFHWNQALISVSEWRLGLHAPPGSNDSHQPETTELQWTAPANITVSAFATHSRVPFMVSTNPFRRYFLSGTQHQIRRDICSILLLSLLAPTLSL